MKALSVRQPYAWAIIHGGKNVENRQWRTPYRGPLLIHAGSRLHAHATSRPWPADAALAPRGGFVGVVDLVDVIPQEMPHTRHLHPKRAEWSRWWTSPWADDGARYLWILENSRTIEPAFVPARGLQGIYDTTIVARMPASSD